MRFRPPVFFPLVLVLTMTLATGAALAAASPAELLSAGRVDDAIQLLQDRVQVAPRDAEAHHLLARIYFYMQRWDDAARAAQRAAALEPSNAEYQLWMGRAVGEKAAHASFVTAVRMVPRIRGAFERAVELDASNIEARSDLAEFYMEAPGFLGGGKDKALAQAELLAQRDPAAAHWVKAQLAEGAKDMQAAEQEYRAAIAATKHPAGRWLDLAGFLGNRGKMEGMENAVNQAAADESIRGTTVPYEAALLLFRAGRNYPLALQLVEKYLSETSQPEAAPAYQAHYLMGQILEKQGKRDAAAEQYRTALTQAHLFDPARTALKRVSQ